MLSCTYCLYDVVEYYIEVFVILFQQFNQWVSLRLTNTYRHMASLLSSHTTVGPALDL